MYKRQDQLVCEEDISFFFLPPSITSRSLWTRELLQVSKDCIGENLSEILCKMEEENSGLVDGVKTINIKNVIYMGATGFEEMPHTTL